MPSVYLITPLKGECEDWLKGNVSEDAMYLGRSLAVEHRYVEDLIGGLLKHGFCYRKDLEIVS